MLSLKNFFISRQKIVNYLKKIIILKTEERQDLIIPIDISKKGTPE